MPTKLEALGINRLSVAERIALVQEIWDSIAADPDAVPLTDAQRCELERRADDDDARPEDTVPWEQVKSEAPVSVGPMTKRVVLRRAGLALRAWQGCGKPGECQG